MKNTVEIDLADAEELITAWKANVDRLRAQRAELDNKISGIESRIANMQARIGTNGKVNPVVSPVARPVELFGGPISVELENPQVIRSPRGQNLDRIVTFFSQATGPQRVAMIAKATQVGLSSVQAVLNRHEDKFRKEGDGTWSYIGKK